ncbi:MAG TPA: S8 family serine peptidase [Rhodothermales bacterium]|nr:S8 family serine peptidase [Rhodothermales bacterium]
MIRPRFTLLACAVLAVAAAGCDAVSDDGAALTTSTFPTPESPKLRHWDLLDGTAASGQAHAGTGTVDFVVTFSSLVADPEAAAEQLFESQTVTRRTYYRDSFTGVAVTAPADGLYDLLNELVASDSVAFVEPDMPLTSIPDAPDYVTLAELRAGTGPAGTITYGGGEWYRDQLRPWGVRRVEADKSWTKAGDGEGTVDVDVYVIDGPIADPDLNVVERRSFLPVGMASAGPLHGTHVAGIIGAMDNSVGLVGVAPGARLHSLEVLDAYGATSMSTLLAAVDYVTQQKRADPTRPVVVNMSLGIDLGLTTANALDESVAAAIEAGVVFVVSAGNGAADAATYSPAHAVGVIAVGAIDAFDTFATTYSNFGGRVTLLAPGTDVLSTAGNGRYASLSGTSMAAPHVAGAAALYLARHPNATPAQVRTELLRGTKAIRTAPAGTTRGALRANSL